MEKQIKKNDKEKDLKKDKRNSKKRDTHTAKNNFKGEKEKKIVKEDVKEVKTVKEEVKVVDNEKKSSKRKTILSTILVVVSILLIGVAFVISVIETNEKGKYFNKISFNEVSELMKGGEIDIIYWASPNCGYCSMFTPIIKNVSYDNKLIFNYLDTTSLDEEQHNKMYEYFIEYSEKYETKGLGTPSLILVQDGKIIDISEGAKEENELISYLKEKELIK